MFLPCKPEFVNWNKADLRIRSLYYAPSEAENQSGQSFPEVKRNIGKYFPDLYSRDFGVRDITRRTDLRAVFFGKIYAQNHFAFIAAVFVKGDDSWAPVYLS